jgi:type I restriction enzyme, S subunit
MNRSVDWAAVPIKDVCESIIDCVNKTAPTVDHQTPYKMIRTTNVRDGWINLDEVNYVDAEIFARWNRRATPRPGDVILTREAPLGEVGMLRGADHVFLGQRLVMYRADPSKLDNRFLLYSFRSDYLQGQIKSLGSGATVEHMRVPDAEKLVLRLPPLSIQVRIGDILSAYDDLIENNTRRIKILEEMAQITYREWFVNFRFPGHEKVRMVKSEIGQAGQARPCRSEDDHALHSRGLGGRQKHSRAAWCSS